MGQKFNEKNKTVRLLLCLTHCIWHTTGVAILDYVFTVLPAIIELLKKGVFAAALIKMQKYWPMHIKRDEIVKRLDGKLVGAINAWVGTLDRVPFHVFYLIEPTYIMSLMAH